MDRFIKEQEQAAWNLGFRKHERYKVDHPGLYRVSFRGAYSFTRPFNADGSYTGYMAALKFLDKPQSASQLVRYCSSTGYETLKYSGLIKQDKPRGPYTLSPLGETYVKTMLEIRKKYF